MNEHRGLWRGKCVDNGEWVEGFPIKMWGAVHLQDKEAECLAVPVDTETLGECIGRCDKKGKPIFEGDIVKTKYGRLCLVEWRKTRQFIGFDLTPLEIKHEAPSVYDLYDCLEIIGNIHDNPEYL